MKLKTATILAIIGAGVLLIEKVYSLVLKYTYLWIDFDFYLVFNDILSVVSILFPITLINFFISFLLAQRNR